MKICLVHNFYATPGGEDSAYHSELELLRKQGHDVITFERHNKELVDAGRIARIAAAFRAPFSVTASNAFIELLRAQSDLPEVVHAHNTFPLITPSLYHACARLGIPVVQTLHNHRLICPAASLFRNDRICTDCLGKRIP